MLRVMGASPSRAAQLQSSAMFRWLPELRPLMAKAPIKAKVLAFSGGKFCQ